MLDSACHAKGLAVWLKHMPLCGEKGAAVEGSQVAQRHTDVQNLGLLTHSFISVLFFQGSGTNSTAWSATIKQFLAAKMQLEPQ